MVMVLWFYLFLNFYFLDIFSFKFLLFDYANFSGFSFIFTFVLKFIWIWLLFFYIFLNFSIIFLHFLLIKNCWGGIYGDKIEFEYLGILGFKFLKGELGFRGVMVVFTVIEITKWQSKCYLQYNIIFDKIESFEILKKK